MKPSKHRLNGKITKIADGIAIYRTYAGPYWYARVWDPRAKKYRVRSTKTESKIEAREIAQQLALLHGKEVVPTEYLFETYAKKMIEKGNALVASGQRNANYVRTGRTYLNHSRWGLIEHFGQRDVRQIRTKDYNDFMDRIAAEQPELSQSTRNTIMATFRNVMRVARDDGTIDYIPDTPRPKQHDRPRPFFWFHPLVAKDADEYQWLRTGAKELAAAGKVVRGVPVTDELYDIIMFCVHAFVRPTTSELYALKHADVVVVTEPEKHLQLTIRQGKTGFRISPTMPDAEPIYRRIHARNPDHGPEDWLFLPQYENRDSARRVIQNQFNALLAHLSLKYDPRTKGNRTVYSLRHTAICMRLVNSEGEVNVHTLAKTAGTSVNQIERFYAKRLPLTPKMIANLQSFGTNKRRA